MQSYIISFTLILGVVLYNILIPVLKRHKVRQAVRLLGPKEHYKKSGTPTMGGLGFIISTLAIYLIFAYIYKYDYKQVILLTIPFFMVGLIGFFDDFLIIKKGTNDGLSPKTKLVLEFIVSCIFFYLYQYFGYSKEIFIDLGIFYLPVVILIITGASNAYNLTDGLDGLCGSLSIISIMTLTYIAYLQKNETILYFGLALIGAVMSFLIFNFNPAKIFMGDTGSLSLGCVCACMAILLKVELLFILIAFVFVLETISVIIQVLYYKKTKKRIFRMAPLHHHFELMGYSEKKVVFLFILMGLIFSICSLIIYGGIR